jgi:hypothetical protein
VKPDRRRRERDEYDTQDFEQFKGVFMIMILVRINGMRGGFGLGTVNARFGDIAERGALNILFGNGHGDLRAVQLKYRLTTAISSFAASSWDGDVFWPGRST